MNDRHDRNTTLLTGAFHDDWADGPTANFARAAAASARRRRAVRRTLAVSTAAAATCAALFVALRPLPTPPVARIAPPAKPAYEIISDDELIARVRDLPLLVVKQPDGTKQITVIAPPPAIDDSTRSE